MKQEPVGWFKQDSYGVWQECWDCSLDPKGVPLYTAPKELSDKEIDDIIQFLNQSRVSWSGNEFIKEAMRLAIKKASEK